MAHHRHRDAGRFTDHDLAAVEGVLQRVDAAITALLSALCILTGVLLAGRLAVLVGLLLNCATSTWVTMRAVWALTPEAKERAQSAHDTCVLAFSYVILSSVSLAQVLYATHGDTPSPLPAVPVALSIFAPATLAVLFSGTGTHAYVAPVLSRGAKYTEALMAIFIVVSLRTAVSLAEMSAWNMSATLLLSLVIMGTCTVDNAVAALERAAATADAGVAQKPAPDAAPAPEVDSVV